MRYAMATCLTLIAYLGLPTANATTYVVTALDVPGASQTLIGGINNAGQVAGNYTNAAGTFGFTYSAGVFTTLMVPGATGTSASGINASGQIVGTYQTANSSGGFIDTNGAYTLINAPGAVSTVVRGINDLGQVVGFFNDGAGEHSFIDTNGVFSIFDVPASFGAAGTSANSINNAGQVAGNYYDLPNYSFSGFVETGGVFTKFSLPSALVAKSPAFQTNPLVFGINNLGQIVGSYNDQNGSHNFVDDHGVYSVFNAPNAPADSSYGPETYAYGINDLGQVVGYYSTTSDLYDGFIASPVDGTAVPEPTSWALLAAGVTSLVISKRRSATRRRIV